MGLLVQQIQGGDFLFRRVVFPMLLHTFSHYLTGVFYRWQKEIFENGRLPSS